MNRADAFRAGVRAIAPVLLGIAPFGLIAGAAAVEVGLGLQGAVAFSVVVFAGAAQLAAIDLLGRGAPAVVVALTALVVNARHLMYSASIAPYLREEGLRWRALEAYVLTDQAFAVSVTRFAEDDLPRRWFYLGAALPLWVVWQACTVVGALAGAHLPGWLPLSFAVPLTFLSLLVPSVRDRPTLAAAVVGGTVATLTVALPYDLGLLAGALAGVVAGVVVE